LNASRIKAFDALIVDCESEILPVVVLRCLDKAEKRKDVFFPFRFFVNDEVIGPKTSDDRKATCGGVFIEALAVLDPAGANV
jgi:hypothetical protein